ncbi:hypothetical protein [Aeromonas phage 65.2]|uniref:Uncharacterized protein n=1 Tax=Aeromonas phage 65.2 TaxID=1932896 RepID=A0A219YC41_9CAUD|nr:hypothetical protein [Aeromonas phage 65.2]
MNINLNEFTDDSPSEPGYYLWRKSYTDVSMIHVYRYPAKDEYGIHWDSYLGVPMLGGRNVANLKGSFLKLEFI